MSETKRKIFYWLFRGLGIVISCAFPIWAVVERYPVWTETHGAGRSLGAGGILIMFVVLIIFRKAVFGFIKEKLKITHAPPLLIWLVLILITYILIFISKILYDITIVFWMGFIGCGIGTFLAFVADNSFNKETKDNE